MYRKIEDFINEWKAETEITLKIFSCIPDEKKAQKINKDVRTLDRLAWHITQTLTEMPFRAGIIEHDYLDQQPIPQSFAEIQNMYKKYSSELIVHLKENWKDTDLTEVIEVYGQKWQRTKTLSVLLNHQIHHRAQMTIIMRLLEIKVPGIYGHSKEEWTNYGMEPQE